MAQRQISPERKAIYYLGMAMTIVGVLMFLSVFVSAALRFGDFRDFDLQISSTMFRAFGGMVLSVIGRMLMSFGARGAAGTGLILDPERARRDVEPWARMTGGMVSDALDEAGVTVGRGVTGSDLPFDEKLRRLHKLHEEGILDEAEYQRAKADVLAKN